jgi:hypothetical protein
MDAENKRKTQAVNTAGRATLEDIKRRKKNRDLRANVITVVMILLTLVMLGYIAWQLANPVTIFVSRVFGGR